jgi:hypothetical protein
MQHQLVDPTSAYVAGSIQYTKIDVDRNRKCKQIILVEVVIVSEYDDEVD